jgi:hypothetical protein
VQQANVLTVADMQWDVLLTDGAVGLVQLFKATKLAKLVRILRVLKLVRILRLLKVRITCTAQLCQYSTHFLLNAMSPDIAHL